MLSRRDLVGKLAVGAAGMVALAASGANAALKTGAAGERSGRSADPVGGESFSGAETIQQNLEQQAAEVAAAPPPLTVPAPPPWELLHPLTLGATVAYGWRVADLSGPLDGACV